MTEEGRSCKKGTEWGQDELLFVCGHKQLEVLYFHRIGVTLLPLELGMGDTVRRMERGVSGGQGSGEPGDVAKGSSFELQN